MNKIAILFVFALFIACSKPTTYGDFSDVPVGAIIDSYPNNDDLKLVTLYSGMFPQEQGDYLNGLRHGTWTTYYPYTPNAQTITTYINGKKQGLFLRLNALGTVEEQLYYHNDLPHGKYVKFTNGAMIEERTYANGQLNGMVIKYYPDGNKMEESPFVNGQRHGLARWYDQQGNIAIEYTYQNGELVKD